MSLFIFADIMVFQEIIGQRAISGEETNYLTPGVDGLLKLNQVIEKSPGPPRVETLGSLTTPFQGLRRLRRRYSQPRRGDLKVVWGPGPQGEADFTTLGDQGHYRINF
jgi:hypothetical protein